MARKAKDFVKNDGGHNDSLSPFLLPENQSPNCRGCHVDSHGKITKRLGLSRVITDGSGAEYNIYRQQGARGLFPIEIDVPVSTPTHTATTTASLTKTVTATDTDTDTLTKSLTTTATDTDTISLSKTKTKTATDTNTGTITITMTADID